MADRLEFKQKLGGILELAKQNNKEITIEEVEQYFEEDVLSKEQMDLVCDYLMAQNVRVNGYTKKGGKILESENEMYRLGKEDEDYLSTYLKELEEMKETDEQLFAFLKQTATLARELHHPEFFLGDLVQEGNLGLMIALKKYNPHKDKEAIMESVKNGIEVFMETQTELKNKDKKIVEKVENLEEEIRKMSEELGREVTIEELCIQLDMGIEEIEELLKMEGERVDL